MAGASRSKSFPKRWTEGWQTVFGRLVKRVQRPRFAGTPTTLPGDAGLTVLELMVVLVILSLIGVVVTIQVTQQLDRAKVDIVKLQLRQLENALELFQIDARRYPTSDEGLADLLTVPDGLAGWRGPYLKNTDLLKDPWGQPIKYSLGDDGHYTLSSTGSDKKTGGDGAAADINLSGGG